MQVGKPSKAKMTAAAFCVALASVPAVGFSLRSAFRDDSHKAATAANFVEAKEIVRKSPIKKDPQSKAAAGTYDSIRPISQLSGVRILYPNQKGHDAISMHGYTVVLTAVGTTAANGQSVGAAVFNVYEPNGASYQRSVAEGTEFYMEFQPTSQDQTPPIIGIFVSKVTLAGSQSAAVQMKFLADTIKPGSAARDSNTGGPCAPANPLCV